jgi:hypothetical protein
LTFVATYAELAVELGRRRSVAAGARPAAPAFWQATQRLSTNSRGAYGANKPSPMKLAGLRVVDRQFVPATTVLRSAGVNSTRPGTNTRGGM